MPWHKWSVCMRIWHEPHYEVHWDEIKITVLTISLKNSSYHLIEKQFLPSHWRRWRMCVSLDGCRIFFFLYSKGHHYKLPIQKRTRVAGSTRVVPLQLEWTCLLVGSFPVKECNRLFFRFIVEKCGNFFFFFCCCWEMHLMVWTFCCC